MLLFTLTQIRKTHRQLSGCKQTTRWSAASVEISGRNNRILLRCRIWKRERAEVHWMWPPSTETVHIGLSPYLQSLLLFLRLFPAPQRCAFDNGVHARPGTSRRQVFIVCSTLKSTRCQSGSCLQLMSPPRRGVSLEASFRFRWTLSVWNAMHVIGAYPSRSRLCFCETVVVFFFLCFWGFFSQIWQNVLKSETSHTQTHTCFDKFCRQVFEILLRFFSHQAFDV